MLNIEKERFKDTMKSNNSTYSYCYDKAIIEHLKNLIYNLRYSEAAIIASEVAKANCDDDIRKYLIFLTAEIILKMLQLNYREAKALSNSLTRKIKGNIQDSEYLRIKKEYNKIISEEDNSILAAFKEDLDEELTSLVLVALILKDICEINFIKDYFYNAIQLVNVQEIFIKYEEIKKAIKGWIKRTKKDKNLYLFKWLIKFFEENYTETIAIFNPDLSFIKKPIEKKVSDEFAELYNEILDDIRAEKSNDDYYIIISYYQLANLYFLQNDYETAIKYLNRSLESFDFDDLKEPNRDTIIRCTIYNKLANAHYLNNTNEDAEKFVSLALQYAENLKLSEDISKNFVNATLCTLYENAAICKTANNKTEEAVSLYDVAIKQYENLEKLYTHKNKRKSCTITACKIVTIHKYLAFADEYLNLEYVIKLQERFKKEINDATKAAKGKAPLLLKVIVLGGVCLVITVGAVLGYFLSTLVC